MSQLKFSLISETAFRLGGEAGSPMATLLPNSNVFTINIG